MNVRETIGYSVLSRFKQWKLLLLMLLFDVLFFISLYTAASLFDAFFALYEALLVGTWKGFAAIGIYFLIVAFSYSFFKYCMLHFISVFYGAHVTKLRFDRIKEFFLYNVCLGLVLTGILFGFTFFVTVALESVFQPMIIQVFFVLHILFSVFFVHASHALFFSKKNIPLQLLAGRVWKFMTLHRLGSYVGWNLCFGLLFLLIFVLVGSGMDYSAQQSIGSSGWYALFFGLNIVMLLYLVLVTYFLIVWNRLYLYALVQKAIGKKK